MKTGERILKLIQKMIKKLSMNVVNTKNQDFLNINKG